jgi:hypothetical protein
VDEKIYELYTLLMVLKLCEAVLMTDKN